MTMPVRRAGAPVRPAALGAAAAAGVMAFRGSATPALPPRTTATGPSATFLTMGLPHDVFACINRYCLQGTLVVDARFMTGFALVAVLYLLWHPIAGLGRRLRATATPLRRAALSILLAVLLNLVMWALAAWVVVG